MKLEWKNHSDYLVKELKFNSQTELATFLLKIAKQSDMIKHHCDMEISKATTLKLKLTTHDSKNIITDKDYDLAEWIDSLK